MFGLTICGAHHLRHVLLGQREALTEEGLNYGRPAEGIGIENGIVFQSK